MRLAWLARDAPDFLNVRKAGRVAIVAPLVLALGTLVVGNAAMATYGVFAAFVGLVFADYGDRRCAGPVPMVPALTPREGRGAADPTPCVEAIGGAPASARDVVTLLAWSMYVARLGEAIARAEPALRRVAHDRAP